MVLNIMSASFFVDIVGTQANKSALVAQQTTQKIKSPLLMAVSGMRLSQSDVVNGKPAEAQQHMEHALRCWEQVAPGVRAHFSDGAA